MNRETIEVIGHGGRKFFLEIIRESFPDWKVAMKQSEDLTGQEIRPDNYAHFKTIGAATSWFKKAVKKPGWWDYPEWKIVSTEVGGKTPSSVTLRIK